MGSTEKLTDGSGNIIASYKYDIFGAVRSSSGSGWTEYRFNAQQDDATLGYTYLRARYYDPATGRFVSKDPFSGVLTSPASQHYYGYAYNNPVNLTDPSGTCPWCVAVPIALVVGGGDLTLGVAILVGVAAGVGTVVWQEVSKSGSSSDDQTKDVTSNEAGTFGSPPAMPTPTPPGPRVDNKALQNCIDALFKTSDRLPGGTAGALRNEARTGLSTSGKFHYQPAQERIANLQDILRRQSLTPDEQNIARSLLQDLQGAIQEWEASPYFVR